MARQLSDCHRAGHRAAQILVVVKGFDRHLVGSVLIQLINMVFVLDDETSVELSAPRQQEERSQQQCSEVSCRVPSGHHEHMTSQIGRFWIRLEDQRIRSHTKTLAFFLVGVQMRVMERGPEGLSFRRHATGSTSTPRFLISRVPTR